MISSDQLFLIVLLLCSMIGLLHLMYYLGYIAGWALAKVFPPQKKIRVTSLEEARKEFGMDDEEGLIEYLSKEIKKELDRLDPLVEQ